MMYVSGGMLMAHFHNFFTVELNGDLNFEYTDLNNDVWNYTSFLKHIDNTFGGNNQTILLDISKAKYKDMFNTLDEFLIDFKVQLDSSGYGWRIFLSGKLISYEAFIKLFQDTFSYLETDMNLNPEALIKYGDNWFTQQCDLVTEKVFGEGWKLNFNF